MADAEVLPAAPAATPSGEADTRLDEPAAKRPRAEGAPPQAANLSGGTCLLRGLPRRMDKAGLERMLSEAGVARYSRGSIKKEWGKNVGFITFGFLADRLVAEAALASAATAERCVTVETAAPRGGAPRAGTTTASVAESGEDVVAEAHARATRDVRDACTPLWRQPYAAQLVTKRAAAHAALVALREGVAAARGPTPPAWLPAEGPACPLLGVVASPVLLGYRNKAELTIGPDAAGLGTVGFNVGLFSQGYACVAEPTTCANVSPACRALAAWVQEFIRARSALPVWDKRAGAGFWRLLLVREGGMAQVRRPDWRSLLRLPEADSAPDPDAGGEAEAAAPPPAWEGCTPPGEGAQVLVMLQIAPDGHEPAAVRAECAALAAELRARCAAASPPLPLAQLLVQLHGGFSNAAPESAAVTRLEEGGVAPPGAPPQACIQERMCGLAFRVSPASFFQTNTAAAEALYELAGEWAAEGEAGSRGVLFDVCCGTGTIGLTLAGRFASVLGVDICEAAVRDANANAELNGVAHARFVAGKAEAALPPLLAEAAAEGLAAVAIVDPPRAGLHHAVLSALRRCTTLQRLVYISCNVTSMAANAVQLCSPSGPGRPFRPVKCLALDLFPHTEHVEAVLLLER